MPRRRVWVPALFAVSSFAGTLLYRRRTARSRTRLDLYFEDGGMASLPAGSPDADRLLPLARELLARAREARR
jgi:hypothetical protein